MIQQVPRPLSDVPETFTSVEAISALTGLVPRTTPAARTLRFAAWFKAWNGHPQEV